MPKDARWVKIGSQRCKVKDLPPELRAKLGLMDEPEIENKQVVIKTDNVSIKRAKVYNEIENERKVVYRKDSIKKNEKESELDLIMRAMGRKIGRMWKLMFG